MFEITTLDGSMIVWGAHYRPDEFCAPLADDGATVAVLGRCSTASGLSLDVYDGLRTDAGFPRRVGKLAQLRSVLEARPDMGISTLPPISDRSGVKEDSPAC
ncbi:MAG: hypothetical protein WEB52_00595 [Dehalococcoidia bacterium]